MLRLEPRSSHSVLAAWLAPLVALVMTFITGGLIFMALGADPAAPLYIYFSNPWSPHPDYPKWLSRQGHWY